MAEANGKDEHARPIESFSQVTEEETQTRRVSDENETRKWLKEKEKELPKSADYYSLLGEVVVL